MWMTKIKRALLPIGIIVLAIVVFVYMKSTKPEQPPVQVKEKVWMVQVIEAKPERLAPMLRLYGQVESNSMVSASAPISGVVDEVWVKEGQTVKAGDKLVAMNVQDLQIPLEQAKAEVADAEAQLRLEKLAYQANVERLAHEKKVLAFKRSDVTRTEQLLKKDLTSTTALEQSKEALARQEYTVVGAQLAVEEHKLKSMQNQARLDKAKAALEQAKLNLKRGTVVAPYDGRIASVKVSAGNRVNAGAVLVEYYSLESMELRAKLPVSEFHEVNRRLNGGETVTALYHESSVSEPVVLKVDRMAGEATTSGVDLFFALPDEMKSSRPGDLLDVELQGSERDGVVAVPYSAIYGNDRVYLVEDGRLKVVKVKLLGDLTVNGALWALIEPNFPEGSKISITHLPNAVSGLKVAEVTE